MMIVTQLGEVKADCYNLVGKDKTKFVFLNYKLKITFTLTTTFTSTAGSMRVLKIRKIKLKPSYQSII